MFLSPEIILEDIVKVYFRWLTPSMTPLSTGDPKERGIIKLNEFKVSRSLKN